MAKPFDATLNSVIDAHPADWAAYLAARVGTAPGPAAVLDTDLSLTVQADKVFRVDGPAPYLLHLELEANPRLGVPADLLRYNVLLGHQSGLPVHTVLLLLRPKAAASDQTGVYQRVGATGRAYLEFHYTVVRVWQESVADFLAAGAGLAPLAVLTDEAARDLPAAFARLGQRLRAADVPGNVAKAAVGSTLVLCGLRYDTARLTEEVVLMPVHLEDSTTYHWILGKGVAQGVQNLILRQAARRFGEPGEAVVGRVRAVTDPDRLGRMADRVPEAAGWDDLLATA